MIRSYYERIDAYDRAGPALNSIVVRNPHALDEARASDERRASGGALEPLDGITYTAKDSCKVNGLTAAAGSPAFEHLQANSDVFVIRRLRAAGAILLGLADMPPMAAGGCPYGFRQAAERVGFR